MIVLCQIFVALLTSSVLLAADSIVGLNDSSELHIFETNQIKTFYVDTRSSEACLEKSVEHALCLSPDELTYPDGALASFRDINWLVGTYGIDGESGIVVAGNDSTRTHMVAAVLYLLGVKEVAVWKPDFSSLASTKPAGRGRGKGILRSTYFTNPMREEFIVLDEDVRQFFERNLNPSVEKLTSTASEGFLIGAPGQDSFVTGYTASAALSHFTQQMLLQQNSGAKIHTDGLGDHSLAEFGFKESPVGLVASITALTLFVVGAYLYGRHFA